jgi:hypothetical protein
MKVTAIAAAFYNGARVRPGAEVEVPDNYKGSWFVKLDAPEAKAARAARAPKPTDPRALSQLAKDGKSFIEAHAGDSLA